MSEAKVHFFNELPRCMQFGNINVMFYFIAL